MKTAYTYIVLRYVHDTTTNEFVNVAVALYAPAVGFASARCRTTHRRLSGLFPDLKGDGFKGLMRFIQSRFDDLGSQLRNELPLEGKPKSIMDLAHSVLPADDSSLQWSPPGTGITDDPAHTLGTLFERFVTRYDERSQGEHRTDEEVWRKYKRNLEGRSVLTRLQPKKITVQDDEVEFKYAWKNGVWHCLEPISLDLSSPDSIRGKAHKWLGQIISIKDAAEKFKVYLLLGEPQAEDLKPAFNNAVSILRKLPVTNEIVREQNAEEWSRRFAIEIGAANHD